MNVMKSTLTRKRLGQPGFKRAAISGLVITGWAMVQGLLGATSVVAQDQANSLRYGELLRAIDAGEVSRIELDPTHQRAEVYLKNQPDRGIQVHLLANNPELIAKLQAQQLQPGGNSLEYGYKPSADHGVLTGLAIQLFLVMILIGGLLMIFRRSANSSNQVLNFGRSRARFQMQAKTEVAFGDVAGIEEAKEEFQEVVTFLKQPEQFTAIGARIPRGVLLIGPPGTGKTLLARAIAGEAGVPFFSISGSEFVEMFVGVGASRVRDLFRKAKESAPCIIFIDEIDAVGRQRGAGIGGGNDEREQTLNQLLTELDGFEGNTGVIVIAATNRPDVLDVALLRPGRFDRQITVDLPDRKSRLGILEVHARTKKLTPEVSLALAARRTPGFSGADLANLLNEAAILTARRRKESISPQEIDDAFDRLTVGLSLTPLLDSKKKTIIAYHEIGHALLATLLKSADALNKVTIIPRSGGIGGFSQQLPDEEMMDSGLYTRAWMLDRITTALGGRATEEEVFGPGEVSNGAASDIEEVTQMARRMVTQYGMSNLGPVALEHMGTEVFLGRDLMPQNEYSEEIATQIDRHVRAIAQSCYVQACRLIREHRPLVDRLVDLLVEQETVDGNEFHEIVDVYLQKHPSSPALLASHS